MTNGDVWCVVLQEESQGRSQSKLCGNGIDPCHCVLQLCFRLHMLYHCVFSYSKVYSLPGSL
jgi:hypothetical protein